MPDGYTVLIVFRSCFVNVTFCALHNQRLAGSIIIARLPTWPP